MFAISCADDLVVTDKAYGDELSQKFSKHQQ